MSDDERLTDLATDAVLAYRRWLQADGWDNPDYDDVIASMDALAAHLGVTLVTEPF